ncbi:MAG: hypothetical protein E6Q68_06210 [Polynucleobacter sp.]|nr:MAG: hypothetical protein E6Q68_06210 [Polynucleobacter sp.]
MSKPYNEEKQLAAEKEAHGRYRRATLALLNGEYAPGARDIAKAQADKAKAAWERIVKVRTSRPEYKSLDDRLFEAIFG